ncbi:MAG: glycoside hydrolase family 127 protein [Oscillospiraceae bacterium]|nr:glycoside hydrolase family 127 protein [Oscillospiraceae bacterium]
MEKLKRIQLKDVEITHGFWANRQKINRDITIYAVRDRFEDTGRFKAFDFGYTPENGEIKPHFFWDSDIAKWIESASFIIEKTPNAELQSKIEEIINKIEEHQDENGYFNIYHTVVEPDNRFKDRSHHELYCLGHLIEAAVAYYNATGKDRFINILDKFIDHVIKVFTEEMSSAFSTPGHEEIELALYRLYEVRPDEKYIKLAEFFLNERGKEGDGVYGWDNEAYNQSHKPVREQFEALGHCVRANYLYAGMADEARNAEDEKMFEACKALFDDMANKKMYISGGIGSTHHGEAFTIPYDLPNDSAYAETCASISLAMFSNRLKDLDINSKYADMVERQIYNGIISGISLDGKSFFYENPLEINLSDRRRHTSVNHSDRLPITQRLEVFDCSCCPPNVTRLIANIGEYIYSYDDNRIFVHQYIGSTAVFDGSQIDTETEYPADGKIKITVANAKNKRLYLRIPSWCESFKINAGYNMYNGYAEIEINSDMFEISLELEIRPVLIAASPKVRADAGAAAVMMGPILYCAEGIDNDFDLWDAKINQSTEIKAEYSESFYSNTLRCEISLTDEESIKALYLPLKNVKTKPGTLKLIPYFGFANRGESDMRVWFKLIK